MHSSQLLTAMLQLDQQQNQLCPQSLLLAALAGAADFLSSEAAADVTAARKGTKKKPCMADLFNTTSMSQDL